MNITPHPINDDPSEAAASTIVGVCGCPQVHVLLDSTAEAYASATLTQSTGKRWRVLNPQPAVVKHCERCGLGIGEWSACDARLWKLGRETG